MIKHGDKLDENLYFCMYPITESTYDELHKLAKAISANTPLLKNFAFTAEALGCSQQQASAKLKHSGFEIVDKYFPEGAEALLRVFDEFDFSNPEMPCFLACLACKKPKDTFSFAQDAATIEMVVAVITNPFDYTIHLGIQRSIVYALSDKPIHPNIAMLLHGCAAKYILQRYKDKQFMVTNPLDSMKKILIEKLDQNMHTISNYDLSTLREKLNLEEIQPRNLLTFNLSDIEEVKLSAVSLHVLAGFAKESIPQPVQINHNYKRSAILLGSIGFFVVASGLILNTLCESETYPLQFK